jgi:hypothetical protein
MELSFCLTRSEGCQLTSIQIEFSAHPPLLAD